MAFPISEDQITKTEAILGRRLPPIYRSMMMSNNGGTAFMNDGDTWGLHPILDSSDRKRLSRTCNHIIIETKSAMNWNGFPDNAVAIGDNGSGDILLILPSAADPTSFEDTIFLFEHETGKTKQIARDISKFEIE